MIVITPGGSPPPLLGKINGWKVCVKNLSRVSDAIKFAFQKFSDDPDGFLYVANGGRVSSARVFPVLRDHWDIAVHVSRIGKLPVNAVPFDGIGQISLDTVLVKRTPATSRVLERWSERNDVHPGREALNLAITLAEMRDVHVLHLKPEWVWREDTLRPLFPNAEPVIDFGSPEDARKTKTSIIKDDPLPPPVHKPRGPEVLWNGHFFSYASYGKINRESMLRVSNSVAVRIDGANKEIVLVDEYTRTRLDPYKETLIGARAPFLRFFGPDFQPQGDRHRINWTLMETDGKVHADMVQKVNDHYDELWVCTQWNAKTFKESGVKVPISVVPLGIDRAIYQPRKRRKMPLCRLISTSKRGAFTSPTGFIFLSVGLPSARKGFNVVADAMAIAFNQKSDVDLVIATTHGATSWISNLQNHVARSRVRVWVLEGRYSEYEMAQIYAASDAYVSASIGEGWNLPAHEASACGKPVIVPRNSVHPEVFGDEAFVFEPDGVGHIPEVESVSPWYVGMQFSLFKDGARKRLAEMMRVVHKGGPEVRRRVELLDDRLSPFTWDATAANVTRRLMEVQP